MKVKKKKVQNNCVIRNEILFLQLFRRFINGPFHAHLYKFLCEFVDT